MSEAIPSVETMINNNRYLYRPMAATPAYKLLLKLGRLVGPALMEMKTPNVAMVIGALLAHADESSVESIIKAFVENSEIDGKPLKGVFEMHFASRFDDMIEFLIFAFNGQYKDFLAKGLGKLKAMSQPIQ